MKTKLPVLAMACLIVSGFGAAKAALVGAPYPNSTFITGISFNFSSIQTYAPGSDIWPATWAADNNIYTAWGDGDGFHGTTKVSWGVGKVAGAITAPTTTDVYYGPAGSHLGKMRDLMAVNGSTLYGWNGTQDAAGDCVLMTSTNNGAAWSTSTWHFQGSTEFAPCSFVQFGKNYAGARDGYIYTYGTLPTPTNTVIYLARALIANMGNRTNYQYCTNIDANNQASWGSISNLVPVFQDLGVGSSGIATVYDAGLGRYLLTENAGDAGGVDVYEGLEPWGPWKTITYQTNWGNLGGAGEMTGFTFPSKWMSADGKSLGLFFAPYGSTNNNWNDHLCTMSVTLTLAPTISIVQLTNGVALTWPIQTESFIVESATNLVGPFNVESPVLSTNLTQQTITATLPFSTRQKFFILKGQ